MTTTPYSDHVSISVQLDLPVIRPGPLAFSVAVAGRTGAEEELFIRDGLGKQVAVQVVELAHRSRMHIVSATTAGVHVSYEATVPRGEPGDDPVSDADRVRYLRPTRYCPHDQVLGFAAREFDASGGDAATVNSIVEWINNRVLYEPGVTDADDDALHPMLTGQGVCRDFAHLGVTLSRALGIPARYASVYAPGLEPMDAHAVFEAAIDGRWRVFDATRLAPRASMVRIATGGDAADAAVVMPLGAVTGAPSMGLTVVSQPGLPDDIWTDLVTLP